MCLTTFLNTSKFLKNTLLRVVFSILFSVFGNVANMVFRVLYITWTATSFLDCWDLNELKQGACRHRVQTHRL